MIVIITAIRIPFTIDSRSSETIRITWTTSEFLAATFVANSPKLYSFRHLIARRKKPLQVFSRSAPSGRDRPTDDLEETAFSITEVATPEFKQTDSSANTRSEEVVGEQRDPPRKDSKMTP
jgi:hypothetical protein